MKEAKARNAKVLLDEVKCTGKETSIANCAHNEWGVHDCREHDCRLNDCSKKSEKFDKDVGVRCFSKFDYSAYQSF